MKTTQSSYCRLAGILLVSLVFAGCSGAPDAPGAAPSGSSGGLMNRLVSSTKPMVLPEGTQISVTLDQALNSEQNRTGDEFDATVAAPVTLNGKTVIPKGARVKGKLVEAKESGRLKGVALLRLALRQVDVEGKSYDIKTTATSFRGGDHKKRNTAMIGGGAAAGAVIGAVAGGGKGAAIGAGVGAGAGTAGAAVTGKKDITLAPETKVGFKLSEAVTIHVKS